MRKTESVTVFTLREGPEFLVPEKRVLIRTVGAVLNIGRGSASNCETRNKKGYQNKIR